MPRRFLAALVLAASLIAVSAAVSAHHNTVSCQSPGVWLIVNSEADKDESFTTNQGHSGNIPAGGSITVNYSGTSLIVYGIWVGGATNTATGEGNCTEVLPSTTSSPVTVSTTPSTPAPTTTVGLSSTSTVLSPSSTPAPTSSVAPATTLSDVGGPTSQPSSTPSNEAGRCTGSCQPLSTGSQLPATGPSAWWFVPAGVSSLATGIVLLALASNRRLPQ